MKKFFWSLLIIATLVLSFSGVANASTQDFVINEFKADYYLSRDEEDRSNLKVVETIVATFPSSDQNHGIERFLHRDYDGRDASLKIVSVKKETGIDWPYTTYGAEDNLVIRIGSADRYLHGTHIFVITYTHKDVTKFFQDKGDDEFYWDVNGVGWSQKFEKVIANIHLDEELVDKISLGERCYYGAFGEDKLCDIVFNDGVYSATVENLDIGENMTVVVGFKADTFAEYKTKLFNSLFEFVIVVAFIAEISGLIFAFIKSRDAKGKGTIIPEYLPPKDADVIISSFVMNAGQRWLPAIYIDLAVRHKIKIVEQKKPGLFGSSTIYEIELISTDDLTQNEKDFLMNIFDAYLTIGSKYTINSKSPDYKLGQKLSTLRASHLKKIKSEGYYRSSNSSRAILLLISPVNFIIFIISNNEPVSDIHSAIVGILFFLTMLNIVLAIGLKSLSEKGRALKDYILGLKLYIKTAEAERLKYLQSVTGAEKIKIDDKASLVKLYEKVLPYAVLLGIEKSWSKVLGDYYQMQGTQPDWYYGQSAFNAAVFMSTVSSFSSSANASARSYESSSGGSGGGGFSGGGGGGGGGGGW